MDFHTVLTLTVMEALLTMDDTVAITVVTTEEVDHHHHHHHQKVPLTTRPPLLPTTRRMARQPPRRANHHLEHLARAPLKDVAADADLKENTAMDMDMDLAEESAEVTDLEVAEDLEDTVEAQTDTMEALMDTVAHHGLAVAFHLADVDLEDSVALVISSTTTLARLERRTSSPRLMSSTPNHPTSYISPFQEPRRKTLVSPGIQRRAS